MPILDSILIIGAGGHGQVVADILLRTHESTAEARPVGFLDDDSGLIGREVLGIPVLGSISEISDFDHDAVIAALGENRRRVAVLDHMLKCGERVISALHPSAVVAPDVALGRGIVVCAGVVVNTGAVIKDGVILNTGSSVDHHCRIGAHCHIAPGVRLGGRVHVGEGALIGIGASVLPGCSVGPWATVGAGAVVTRDIPTRATAVGIPAREVGGQDGS